MGGSSTNGSRKTQEQSTLKLFTLAAGVIGSFTAFGFAQEAVTKTKFGNGQEVFKYSTFLVLLQSVGNAIVAAIVLFARDGRKVKLSGGVAAKDWLIVACGYFGAHKCGLSALSYISFPMQVVCKSCKAIPVMLGERLLAGKKHNAAKMCGVFCMSFGVAAFTLLGPKKGGKEMHLDAQTMIGLSLVFGALICDGIYGPYQNKIVNSYKPKPNEYHLMFNMNFAQLLISLSLCLIDFHWTPGIPPSKVSPRGVAASLCLSFGGGELTDALHFIERHPAIIPYLALFAAAMATGNIFIYKLQAAFGALTVTTVTTMRKLISVVSSVLIFGHTLSPAQWIAVLIVIFYKYEGEILAIPFKKRSAPVILNSNGESRNKKKNK
mmetsp:Transcript_8620/g.13259  ORF Transcript_8620/g.13259 Transcript_8620/m.13259 type:complete len:379 (-) Transcript_8620:2586-3722(-)